MDIQKIKEEHQADVDKLVSIVKSRRFAQISELTIIEAWYLFSKEHDSEWLPLYGFHIYDNISTYLPKLHGEDSGWGWGMYMVSILTISIGLLVLGIMASETDYNLTGWILALGVAIFVNLFSAMAISK